ncbi:hypothetical protein [uncultured Roseibium sp.]|uniref:hypothetical protein n=1 Tax=uncultured Roseibium sp. TaxID=1936171 RepID=UPI002614A856|nr:hypothetical protein [uncultured Roseibium sp.]
MFWPQWPVSADFFAFYDGLQLVKEMPGQTFWLSMEAASIRFPDVLVSTGLAIIVLLTIFLGQFFDDSRRRPLKTWIDRMASAIGLVFAALYYGASWITFAAVSFVSASTCGTLRQELRPVSRPTERGSSDCVLPALGTDY